MRDYRLASFPANLTAILWSFLVFILMVIYSANLTANLTINQFKNDIRGLHDLPGKAVGSWEGYQEELKKYNIASMGMPWNSPEDEVAMINTLKSGLIKALVFDNNLLEIYDATDCDTMLVGDQFDLRDQCVTFAPNTWQNHPGFVDAFDIAMLTVVQGTGGIEELINRFIKVAPAACKNNDLGSGYTTVSLPEVAGLWVILCLSIIFCTLFVVFFRLWESKIGPWAARKGWYNPKHTKKIKASYITFKKSGFSSEIDYPYEVDGINDEDEVVQYRYTGASKGYVDGSTDVFPNGVPPKPKPKAHIKEGYMTKRRKKFGITDDTPSASFNRRNDTAVNLPPVAETGPAPAPQAAAAVVPSQVPSSIAAAAPVPTPAVANGVILPNGSATIESPRSFANRMVTFKLSDADYDLDGDNQV